MIHIKTGQIKLINIFMFFITVSLLYPIRIEAIGLEVHKILIVLLGVITWFMLGVNRQYGLYISKPISRSIGIWVAIFLWGLILGLDSGLSTGHIYDYLTFYISIALFTLFLSYYFTSIEAKVVVLYTVYIFAIVSALIGLFEAITGNYLIPYVTVEKNLFGLYAPTAFFYNSNDFAVFLVMSMFTSLILSEYAVYKKRIQLVSIILFGICIILTESRGGFLGWACIVYFFYSNNSFNGRKYLRVLFTLLLCVFIVYWIVEFIDIGDFNVRQMGGRSGVWKKSMEWLVKSNYLGAGPGNTFLYNVKYRTYSGDALAAVHNFFLEMLCDTGIIGGALVVIWYGILLYNSSFRYKDVSTQNLIRAFLIAFLPMSVSASSLIFEKAFTVLFLAIAMAELNYNLKVYGARGQNGTFKDTTLY